MRSFVTKWSSGFYAIPLKLETFLIIIFLKPKHNPNAINTKKNYNMVVVSGLKVDASPHHDKISPEAS